VNAALCLELKLDLRPAPSPHRAHARGWCRAGRSRLRRRRSGSREIEAPAGPRGERGHLVRSRHRAGIAAGAQRRGPFRQLFETLDEQAPRGRSRRQRGGVPQRDERQTGVALRFDGPAGNRAARSASGMTACMRPIARSTARDFSALGPRTA